MKSDTQTLIDALRILAREIQSGDGVANACIAEAADRLEELSIVEDNRQIDGVLIRNPHLGIAPLPNDVLIDYGVLKQLQATRPEWQPIETAPKDGTYILLANAAVEDGHIQCAYWDEGRWHPDDYDGSWHAEMFTHWMPLPEPPREEAAKAIAETKRVSS